MHTPLRRFRFALSTLAALVLCTLLPAADGPAAKDGWIDLFNGKNLDGWTVKIAKHPLGVNHADTFRVEDGILKVAYDRYGVFERQFGHLYTNLAYSHYILRLEYLFTGSPMADAPEWAGRNSGVMVHAASPLTMTQEQEWPVSMEVQFLCVNTKAGRQTGNAVSPGTHLEIGGKLVTNHIVDAHDSKLSPMDEWVSVEVEVRGHDEIIHRINGVEVMRYQHPQLDPGDPDAKKLLAMGSPLKLASGHIALQAESQPVWFRNIRLRVLER
jgi:hypothetical protein